jgi:hypothetical protein
MSTSADDSETRVGCDGSPASDAAVRWPAREAVMCNAPLPLVHVIVPALTTMRSESVQSVPGDGNSGTRTTSSTAMANRGRSGPVLIVRLP